MWAQRGVTKEVRTWKRKNDYRRYGGRLSEAEAEAGAGCVHQREICVWSVRCVWGVEVRFNAH